MAEESNDESTEPLRESTLPDGLPSLTIGWGVLAWAAMYLRQPDGKDAGEPFMFTREQARLLLWWYAVDENGHFLFTSGVIRRMKGHGKDPLAAALSLIELCGPTQFSHFDEDGNAIGRPQPAPWVQTAAVSREQNKNTFTLFPNMISPELKAEFGLETHKEIIHKQGGGRVEAVTSSPKSLEGGRAHFIVMNETQFWVGNNEGKAMAEAIAGNAAKGRAETPFRRLGICNAHRPGEESVAEDDYEFYLKIVAGESRASKFFYDALEAPPGTNIQDPESLREGLLRARGDSTWLDVDRLMEEVWDDRTTPSEARRKYLNQIVAAEDDWLTPQQWDAVSDRTLMLEAGDTVTLGFDGSKGDDHTALCACRVSDGALFLLNVWNPSKLPDGKLNPEHVDEAVDHYFNKLNVVSFRADVKEFEAYIDRWTAKYQESLRVKATAGSWIAYDMRSKSKKDFIFACEKFESAVIEHELSHDGNRILRQHILNSKRRPNNYGIGISKESKDSSRKIDAAVTAVLAFEARQEFLMSKYNVSQEVGIF